MDELDPTKMSLFIDKLFAYIRLYVHNPCATFNSTTEKRDKDKKLQMHTTTQTTTNSTEHVAIQLESDIELTKDTLRTIIDSEINKKQRC